MWKDQTRNAYEAPKALHEPTEQLWRYTFVYMKFYTCIICMERWFLVGSCRIFPTCCTAGANRPEIDGAWDLENMVCVVVRIPILLILIVLLLLFLLFTIIIMSMILFILIFIFIIIVIIIMVVRLHRHHLILVVIFQLNACLPPLPSLPLVQARLCMCASMPRTRSAAQHRFSDHT